MRGSFVAVGLIVALAGSARAERDPVVAKRLFSEGRVLYDQGKFIEACVLFEKSYQLDPAVGTKLNLAECAERDRKPRAAWLLWISAADEFERDSDNRAKFARGRADALAPKLATVIVRLAKPKQQGLTIQIAGREVAPAAELVERLDPGAIAVSAKAPDREPFETEVTVALGGKVIVEIPALARIGGLEPDPPPPVEPHPTNWWRPAAFATGALTVAAVAFTFVAAHRVNTIEDEATAASMIRDVELVRSLNAEGKSWELRGRIAMVTALGGAVATTVLFVQARRVGRRHALAAQLAPLLGPQLAGAQLALRW